MSLGEAAAEVRRQIPEVLEIWAAREKEVRDTEAKASAAHGEVKGNADMARDKARQLFAEVS